MKKVYLCFSLFSLGLIFRLGDALVRVLMYASFPWHRRIPLYVWQTRVAGDCLQSQAYRNPTTPINPTLSHSYSLHSSYQKAISASPPTHPPTILPPPSLPCPPCS